MRQTSPCRRGFESRRSRQKTDLFQAGRFLLYARHGR